MNSLLITDPEELLRPLLSVGVVFSLLQCFFGYRLLKFWITAIGFFVGLTAGFGLSVIFIHENGISWLHVGIGLFAGLLAGFFAFKLYLAGVFIVCGTSAFVAVQALPLSGSSEGQLILLAGGILAFLFIGFCCMHFAKAWIIVTTAVTGAANAVHALQFTLPALGDSFLLSLLSAAALAALGILFQRFTSGGSFFGKKSTAKAKEIPKSS